MNSDDTFNIFSIGLMQLINGIWNKEDLKAQHNLQDFYHIYSRDDLLRIAVGSLNSPMSEEIMVLASNTIKENS